MPFLLDRYNFVRIAAVMKIEYLALMALVLVGLGGCEGSSQPKTESMLPEPTTAAVVSDSQTGATITAPTQLGQLTDLLRSARRIPNSTKWFEIIALPNDVYALWEPGHMEKVNSFLIVGSDKDVLYDTGMGIGSIGQAVSELRLSLDRGSVPLMVINSHNHLDHNGGNADFEQAWIIKDEWAIRKLTEGVSGGFETYWSELTSHEGVEVPRDFNPATFAIRPFPYEGIRFLQDGDVVDLGNRQFKVLHTVSHSPDGLCLYDETNHLFFGGDTFGGDFFLSRNLELLEQDLARAALLEIDWHYVSHGAQLIQTMREGWRLSIVRRMLDGEREEGTLPFAGNEFPLYTLEGVQVAVAAEFLTY